MNKITNLQDSFLLSTCRTAATSAMDLLQKFDRDSYQYLLHTSGLAFGIWISICDQDKISLEDIDTIINEMVMSDLN